MNDATDDLIEDVIVDAYGPYEQLCSFRQVFEDTAAFPFAARIIGVDILVEEIDYEGDELRGLIAICHRDGQRHTVSLLDVSLAEPVDPETAQLFAAYRRWLAPTRRLGQPAALAAGRDRRPYESTTGCASTDPSTGCRHTEMGAGSSFESIWTRRFTCSTDRSTGSRPPGPWRGGT